MLPSKSMQRLFDILEPVPWGWRVGILVMLLVIFVFAPLDLLLKRFVPKVGNAKFGPEFPVLSKNGRILFNAILYSFLAMSGVVIQLISIGNRKTTLVARLGVSAFALVFAVLAVTEFAAWRKARTRKESHLDNDGRSHNDD